jgi:hypothetical protein
VGEKFVRVLFVGTFFMQFSLSGDKESCIRFSCCVRNYNVLAQCLRVRSPCSFAYVLFGVCAIVPSRYCVGVL